MKLDISEIPLGDKSLKLWHFTRIAIKSTDYSVENASFAFPKRLIQKMIVVCLNEGGIGLAAPQVGVFNRLFIIRDFELDSEKNNQPVLLNTFSEYINPTWKAVQEHGKSKDREGCLSVPDNSLEIERWNTIEASWFTWEENPGGGGGSLVQKTETMTGYKARVFQHEFDHLSGVSIVDRWKRQN
jgi:peptide deformylase